MTPAAPTATWRKLCEQYFSRLAEDLDQQIESELESRVSVAVEAAVREAVADAVAETRRASSSELNQAARCVRQTRSAEEVYGTLLDVTAPFCEQAAVFSIRDGRVHAERVRRSMAAAPGEDAAGSAAPPVEFPVSDAAAFSTAISTRDPVIAMSTPAEISPALVEFFEHKPEERVYLFPLIAGEAVAGLFYAAGNVQPPPVELVSLVAGLQLRTFTVANREAVPAASAAAALEAKSEAQLVTIAGMWNQPVLADASSPDALGAQPHAPPRQRREWWDLTREEQQLHLAAQRLARVLVAEIRLASPDRVRSGRAARDVYAALKPEIDAGRERFRDKHMTASPSMVDYLHLELVRSLADDDPTLLGPDYPGPLV